MVQGWTISQWRDHMLGLKSSEGLSFLLDHLSTLSSDDPAWIQIATPSLITSQWENLQKLPKAKDLPLYGVPCVVKDNIDVAGFNSTAACPAYSYLAAEDAVVVDHIKKAGAIVLGKSNLDQFATGLVGTRSPYGKVPNAFSPNHVSGGSSSGSASTVARGIAPFSFGTDTAGSGRVPAGLNNIIGLKPSLGLLSCTGVIPACRSLDTVSIFALVLADAQLVFSIVAKYDPRDGFSRALPENPLTTFGPSPRFAIPDKPLWYNDTQNPELYEKALDNFKQIGVELVPNSFDILYKLAACLYEGPWVAERYAAISDFIKEHKEDMDPVVREIILKAENFSAEDAFKYEYLRKNILRQVEIQFADVDGFIVPTCPLVPSFEDIAKEPIACNSKQGTYTNFVNLSDLSALAIPVGFRKDGLPFGVTLISRKFNDYALLDLAEKFLSPKERLLGNSNAVIAKNEDRLIPGLPKPAPTVRVSVVGAHLKGMPLHYQLEDAKAVFVEKTSTSPNYKLYALAGTVPAKPGLRKVASGGVSIEIETYDIPVENFGKFVSLIPGPLGIGSVELASGEIVKGFICEESGYSDPAAVDISHFGGWRKYIESTKTASVKRPFDKVLIANRGEIAVRILKTLKKMKINSVSVYSASDRYAPHALEADEAIFLEGDTAAETYLSIEKIIAAAKKTNAQAIIPGYGFLSENADFAEACEKNSIVFVGPSASVINSMGLKHSARAIAEKAKVPLVPGTGLLASLEETVAAAKKIEYPVMLKSTAGGGGIGLQRCNNEEELVAAYDSVRRLGQQFFNDSGVFLERFIDNSRHVEVQIFGDGRGGAISLGERDCSLQRRNQKVIEETPGPFIPEKVRMALRQSAESLARTMKYKCAGTVEFIYDSVREEFYFLEVNTRLQVEHPVTEEVTGLDLVEWMLLVAADTPPDFSQKIEIKGASMEARLYAENPAKDFNPSPGQITNVSFPDDARIDTWISKGSEVSANYDPMIAKIIVYGKDRNEALDKLIKALDETSVGGIVTNIDYLRAIARTSFFRSGDVYTRVLDTFSYKPNAVEVTAPGSYTTVQDYPGRKLLWHIGVPPSGPMDDYAFRMANRLVGNHSNAPGIECTLMGPTFLFHRDGVAAVCGGEAKVTIDDEPVSMWRPIQIRSGQKLSVGKLTSGCRSYIAIRGGIDVPEYLGSRSTFALGNMGGFNGRILKFGDVIFLGDESVKACEIPAPVSEPVEPSTAVIPRYPKTWKIGVMAGPHTSPDFFLPQSIETFLSSEWKVHYNSNRFGVRLIGPKPEWARKDGGEAGLHPSNAHDYVYAIGALNFTGDEPVILTCDGPSLGGFVCPVTVVEAEMWKVGQLKPGDMIQFVLVDFQGALQLKKAYDDVIENLKDAVPENLVLSIQSKLEDPVLYRSEAKDGIPKIVYRQAGDRYILVEYGDNVLDLRMPYRVYRLTQLVFKNYTTGVIEMSPGVRSVLIEFNGAKTSQKKLLDTLIKYENELVFDDNWTVPCRRIRLPMAFEDSKTLAAVQRYQETIRSKAPWLPNNVDFLQKVNQLDSRDKIKDLMYRAQFLVLGVGDVFLGAPCAVPLDPRDRLVGTKYNPSRTFTPEGTVGLGGMYMCIYGMDSPGGYQLIGRTIPIWDKLVLGQQDRPWLVDPFDIIEYYPISEEELDKLSEEVKHGRYTIDITQSVFNHGEYCKWMEENKTSIDEYQKHVMEGTEEIAKLIQVANDELEQSSMSNAIEDEDFGEDAVMVYGEVAGRFWKGLVQPGDKVVKGQGLIVVEAMKTEMTVTAPQDGEVLKVCHKSGDFVEAGDLVAVLK
ncbi:hypothetical protein CANCADRAFT_146769 [Tortispora caseinolytica NRRL Y-17796]|uniref:Urea amidolyase n=1 Tax=Tortispora caseinolytica NRRL Y-17796 TaxID=767744 RepID=A0A1E4T9N7_9ASCO|nr:hypothetical protein CANCADRAFT_146769 [Tortispora caseinolytica NRRL Y-17796]